MTTERKKLIEDVKNSKVKFKGQFHAFEPSSKNLFPKSYENEANLL